MISGGMTTNITGDVDIYRWDGTGSDEYGGPDVTYEEAQSDLSFTPDRTSFVEPVMTILYGGNYNAMFYYTPDSHNMGCRLSIYLSISIARRDGYLWRMGLLLTSC